MSRPATFLHLHALPPPPSPGPARGRVFAFAVFAPVLRHRVASLALIGLAILHLSLKCAGLAGVPCPLRELGGVPCPGCGLGGALASLARLGWREALLHHALSPVFAAGLLLLVLANLLPQAARHVLIERVATIESRFALGPLFAGALLFHWLLRLG